MSRLILLILLGCAAWSANSPGAPGADIVAFAAWFALLPGASAAWLWAWLAPTAQVSVLDHPRVWRGPSALNWVLMAITLGCLLAAHRPWPAAALWAAWLITAGARLMLQMRLRALRPARWLP